MVPESSRLHRAAVSPHPGTTSASSRTATPATPSPRWRTDTPSAAPTSPSSSSASADKSSSANRITQTWVSRRVGHAPPAVRRRLGAAPGTSLKRGNDQSGRRRERKGKDEEKEKALSDVSRSKEALGIPAAPEASVGATRVQRLPRGQDRNRISFLLSGGGGGGAFPAPSAGPAPSDPG